jgi:hypothetical protein
MASELIDRKRRAKAIVSERLHRAALPFLCVVAPPAELRSDRIVAVGEHVGFDRYTLADHAFDRKAAGIDLRCDSFDDDASAAIDGYTVRGAARGIAHCGSSLLKITTDSGGKVALID